MTEELHTTQQVLRALALALAFSCKADKVKLAFTLQTLASTPNISDDASFMLLDLARAFELDQKQN